VVVGRAGDKDQQCIQVLWDPGLWERDEGGGEEGKRKKKSCTRVQVRYGL